MLAQGWCLCEGKVWHDTWVCRGLQLAAPIGKSPLTTAHPLALHRRQRPSASHHLATSLLGLSLPLYFPFPPVSRTHCTEHPHDTHKHTHVHTHTHTDTVQHQKRRLMILNNTWNLQIGRRNEWYGRVQQYSLKKSTTPRLSLFHCSVLGPLRGGQLPLPLARCT